MAEFSSTQFSNSLSLESSSDVFEPDVMLPSQLLLPDENGLVGGERRLMAAILSDGIEAYIAHQTADPNSRSRLRAEAAEWVDTKDETYVFSFDNVCACLGIEADYLRLGLGRYIQAVIESRSKAASGEKCAVAWRRIRRPRKH